MKIDRVKLEHIKRKPFEIQTMVRGLTQEALLLRDEWGHDELHFSAGNGAGAHWRPGDSPGVFLDLPPEVAQHFPAEVRMARRIAQKKNEHIELHARIAALHQQWAAAHQLATACEVFASQNPEA